jgi:hypothetical protein
MPAAEAGDTKAAGAVLRIIERSPGPSYRRRRPLGIVLERHRDLEGGLVADALAAALMFSASPEQRMAALGAAQRRLRRCRLVTNQVAECRSCPATPHLPGRPSSSPPHRRTRNLSVAEAHDHIPFDILRVYYLYNITDGRGGAHATFGSQQVLLPVRRL